MTEFLPEGSLYVFIGVATVLFTMMFACFLYYKGKTYLKTPILSRLQRKSKKMAKNASFKGGSRRNEFLRKKGERADGDEENGNAESLADKMKAQIDAKYNTNVIWTTIASVEVQEQAPSQTQPISQGS